MTNALNLLITLCLAILLSRMDDHRRIYWITSLCYFPLVLTFMGKDAGGVSTICIYLFCSAFLIKKLGKSDSLMSTVNILLLVLIIIGGISTLSVPKGELTGPAVRRYSGLISSLLLFFYVSNLSFPGEHQQKDFIEKLLSVTLVMVAIQVIISLWIYKYPAYSGFLNYFQSSKSEPLKFQEDIRAVSLVFSGESYGEFLAIISPIALYKIFYRNSLFYIVIFLLLCLGLIASLTRSGIILFALATFVFLFYHYKKRPVRLVFPFLFGIAGILCLATIFPEFVNSLGERFRYAQDAYASGSDFAEIINRNGAWNMDYVLANLNLFGHGLIPVPYYGVLDRHLHNLFQTVLFQLGVVGFICFFSIFFVISKRLIHSFWISHEGNKALIFSALLSLVVFFINECKFEFNRHEAYQQLCWILFSVYYLASRLPTIPAVQSQKT